MPFVLRKQGVPVDRIAGVVAIAAIPSVWFFAYAPVVDLGLRRKTWIIMGSIAAGLFCAVSTLLASGSLTLLTIVLFLASAASGLCATANGTLLSMLLPNVRGRASGWYQAGNLGAGAIGAGVAIWLAGMVSLPVLSLAVLVLVAAPVLAAVMIEEGPRRQEHARLANPTAVFKPLVRDLRAVFWSPRALIGLVFFLSPVTSGAVANLISGVGPDYHAPDVEVLWITGIAGGLLSAIGSFAGGYVCDRMNRMAAYALAGGLCAVFATYMGFAPFTPLSFGAGYSGYSLATGFGYAVFTALVLEVLGNRQGAAGTSYSILVASGNIPISYMTYLDGVGYKHWGVRGLMGVDALAEGGGAIVLLLIAWFTRHIWHKTDEDQVAA
jgi:MFS transporter, PAT family, beta-lactamase induction signal transducer AmpG